MTQGNNNDTAFDIYDNDSNVTFLLFKTKILNAIKFMRDWKICADLEAMFDHLTKTEASIKNVDKELIENFLSQLVNCKLIINKKTHTGLDSFRLTAELQSEFSTTVDEESQTENQNDVHEENLDEHGSSLILENSILPININIPNSSDIRKKSLLSQNKLKVEAHVTALKSYVACEISSINNKIESLFERLNKMSSTENKALEILQEKYFFLQKELTSKDEKIKTLIETQTSILESVSHQKSKNELNELVNQLESSHQSSIKINSSKSSPPPHLLNRTPKYHHNVNTNTSGVNKNSCETNKNIPEPENQQSQRRNNKQTFVDNDLNIKNLKELFSLETTKYLKENCSITMSINSKTGKNIAFVLSPDHVHDELLKLNGIEFHGKSLILEEAMSSGKTTSSCRKKFPRKSRYI